MKFISKKQLTISLALSAIPQIVCDTINSMKLMNKTPTWSIRDEHGLITVTLQWEHPGESKYLSEFDECSWKLVSTGSHTATTSAAQYDKVYSSTFPRHSSGRSYLRGASSRNIRTAPSPAYDIYRKSVDQTLPSKALSAEDFSIIDRGEDLSSAADLTSYCDFHCSSLHREGGSITVSNRSVGTSPILDRTISPLVINALSRTTSPFDTSMHIPLQYTDSIGSSSQQTIITTPTGTVLKAKKGPVRFMDVEKETSSTSATSTTNKPSISLASLINGQHIDGSSSDDSETETTEREEEQLNEKALLLIDQLSIDQKRHLSIKDIGIILERLNSKIVDIDKLERDKESAECYNWLIKGTIKGDVLREIGVIYNGHYYGIMEHPGYY